MDLQTGKTCIIKLGLSDRALTVIISKIEEEHINFTRIDDEEKTPHRCKRSLITSHLIPE